MDDHLCGRIERGNSSLRVRMPDESPDLTPGSARVLLEILVELDERKRSETS
jgi:hypothetical protein